MKHQDSVSNEDLDNFFVWISQREEVSLEVRRDFLTHVLNVGYFDQKALDFIESIKEKLEQKSKERVEDLLNQIQLVENAMALQQKPETSLAKKITTSICNWMNETTEKFKNKFRAKEKSQSQKEESAEETENQLLVDRLKVSLN